MGIEVKKLEKYIDIYDIFRILMSQDNFKDNKILIKPIVINGQKID